jgi:hypothetical protein
MSVPSGHASCQASSNTTREAARTSHHPTRNSTEESFTDSTVDRAKSEVSQQVFDDLKKRIDNANP